MIGCLIKRGVDSRICPINLMSIWIEFESGPHPDLEFGESAHAARHRPGRIWKLHFVSGFLQSGDYHSHFLNFHRDLYSTLQCFKFPLLLSLGIWREESQSAAIAVRSWRIMKAGGSQFSREREREREQKNNKKNTRKMNKYVNVVSEMAK